LTIHSPHYHFYISVEVFGKATKYKTEKYQTTRPPLSQSYLPNSHADIPEEAEANRRETIAVN